MKTVILSRGKYLLAFVALCISTATATTMPSPKITKGHSLGPLDPLAAALDSANNLILSAQRGLVQAFSPTGMKLWQVQLQGNASAIVADNAGNSYLTGQLYIGSFAIWKISPAGTVLWTYYTAPPAASPSITDNGTKIVLDDQGGVYAAGYSNATSADLFLLKCNTAGEFQWSRRFNGAADLEDKATGLAAMPGGGVVVTGITRNSTEQFITIRYSAAGVPQFSSFYDFPDATEEAPCGIVRTSDGGVAIAGMSGTRVLATVKYSGTGDQLWANRTEITDMETTQRGAGEILAGPDGGAVVLATAQSGDVINGRLIAIKSNGETDWNTLFYSVPSHPGYYMQPDKTAMTLLPDGGYAIAAGVSWNYSGVGAFGRVFTVDFDGGNVALADILSESINYPNYWDHLLTGTDGSVWAVAQDEFVRFGPVPAANIPVITNVGFDNLQTTSVRLKGTVNPSGYSTTYHYEFGPTTAYGSSTPVRTLPAGTSDVDAFEPGVTVSAGTAYHFRLVATNTGGAAESADQTFTVPQSGYQMWTVTAFGSLTAPGSGATDDPDGDRNANLVEYAFGGNATTSESLPGLPVFSLWESTDSGLTFPSIVYHPDPSATEVTITPVASNDLMTWTTNGVVVTNLPNGGRRAVAQGKQRFMRLLITSP